MEKANVLIQTVKEGKWEEAESLWLEVLEDKIDSVEPFHKAAHEMFRRGQQQRTKDLLQLTAEACSDAENPSLWVSSLRMLIDYKARHKGFVEDYAKAFKKLYADRSYLASWVDRITRQKMPANELIETLDKLVIFKVGTIVKHKSGWGIGQITSIDEENMEMFMDLEKRPDHRMDALAAADCLVPLPPENFEAMLVMRPGKLIEEAQKAPLPLIHRVLKFTARPTSARDIKRYLCPKVVDESQWNKWWPKVRKQLVTDPFVDAAIGAHGKYNFRDTPLDWEEEIQKSFDEADDFDKVNIILEYLKNPASKKRLKYFATKLEQLSADYLAQHPWHSLEAYLVLQECISQGASVEQNSLAVAKIFAEQPVDVFCKVRIAALAQKTFDLFIEQRPDWQQDITKIFKNGSDLARDTLYRYLKNQNLVEQYMPGTAQTIIKQRLTCPDALLWFTRQIIAKRMAKFPDCPDLFTILELMIQTGNNLKSIGRWDVKKAGKVFTLAVADKLAEIMAESKAKEFLATCEKATWLSSVFRKTLDATLREHFPEVFTTIEPIYTTNSGLHRYEEEYRDLLDNKIPENAKAIGEAISFGDLSENAELDAAQELRIQLTNKAAEMEENMKRTVIINASTISEDKVVIGSRVHLQSDEGEKVQYDILGPWDVSLDQDVISYMSPIAQALLNAQQGDVVNLPTGAYKVMAIARSDQV